MFINVLPVLHIYNSEAYMKIMYCFGLYTLQFSLLLYGAAMLLKFFDVKF